LIIRQNKLKFAFIFYELAFSYCLILSDANVQWIKWSVCRALRLPFLLTERFRAIVSTKFGLEVVLHTKWICNKYNSFCVRQRYGKSTYKAEIWLISLL